MWPCVQPLERQHKPTAVGVNMRSTSPARVPASAQVRDMTGTGEVTKRRVREGRGEFPVDCPLEDCAVRVHFRVRRPGSQQVPPAFLSSSCNDGVGEGRPPLAVCVAWQAHIKCS